MKPSCYNGMGGYGLRTILMDLEKRLRLAQASEFAELLLDQFGGDAATYAAARLEDAHEHKDLDRQRCWRDILGIIEREMRRRARAAAR